MKPASLEIIKALKKAGFEAYWAGGCVRDMLLGVEPKDFDIATSARPEEIKKILKKTIPVGEQFGVILAEKNGHHFEVATFRSDSGYSDGRRPDAVIFTHAEEDAQRRDFTINGLFYDPLEDKILDFVDGQKDLDAKLVRFIGDPHKRILEDHLRIIRAIRFKNIFGFQYHPATFQALKKHAALSAKVSGERIRDELNKMIGHASFPEALKDMEDLRILEAVLPEIQAMKGVAQPREFHHEGDVFEHTIRAVQSLKPSASLNLRWAVFLHDVGKPETFKLAERIRFDGHCERSSQLAEQIMRRLKFPLKDIKQVQWLVIHHMSVYQIFDMTVARRRKWFLEPLFLELLELNRCDAAGTEPVDEERHDRVLELYRKDLKEMPKKPEKLVSGEDVMRVLNIPPGKKVQKFLDEMNELQLEKKIRTKKEALKWLAGRANGVIANASRSECRRRPVKQSPSC